MLQIIEQINTCVNNFIWGIPAMICIIGVGLYLSIRTRFIQIRRFPLAVKTVLGRLFRRDEVTPPYIAILPQSFLPRPYPINVRARRALRIYYLLSFIYYLFCPAGALSSPMVHRSATSREITTKKQPYVFRKAVPWCTIGDSNPGPTD